ncbi:MAG: glutamate synthase large subunit [Myxococcaceae bacterium]|nr:glutamate synthase large subunit [Myxococcaceae bacterium]
MTQSIGLDHGVPEHDACGVGFVANLRGGADHALVEDALTVLQRLSHRAATGADSETGDGAGILVQLPHLFLQREAKALGFELPRPGRYGVGMVFLPADPDARAACEAVLAEAIADEGQRLLGMRDVPVDVAHTGPTARAVLPVIRQVFVGARRVAPTAFERTLFVIRKLAENRVRERRLDPDGRFHVASLSSKTLVYKGLLLPRQLPRFYPDLSAVDFTSALAVVHSRFSTNTFPTWDLAQPMRFIAHNGEINTVRGNRNWMLSRRAQLQSAKFGDLRRLDPIIVPGKSDSAQFDNMVELLTLGGRSLPHAMMMMIPEAWAEDRAMDDARRAFYEYSGSLMEPWDGPAAIVFTDGALVGATLDRNGLRPARYAVTDDDRVVLASETGVLDLPPERVVRHGRLQPGRMFLVDTVEGRIVEDDEVKRDISGRWPYRRWLEDNVMDFESLPGALPPPPPVGESRARLLRAFGYTDEDLELVLQPMADTGKEPTGSMGTDTPLAVMSDRAPSLFDYFHQLFAQVTNPAIDPYREALVMSLATAIGPDGNTFEETPEQCHRLSLPGPILTNGQVARLRTLDEGGLFQTRTLSMHVRPGESLSAAVDRLTRQAVEAVDDGCGLLILSDRGVDASTVPMPALLGLSAVHQRLVRDGIRRHTGLLVETAEAREVHHVALLIGFGAAAVNPWLAMDCVSGGEAAQANLVHACEDGLRKVMSKMGISSVQSYRGAQIFEAVGLSPALVQAHFGDVPSPLAGVGLAELEREARERHARGFATDDVEVPVTGGYYQWRRRGEHHVWNPATLAALQAAVKSDDREAFARYEALADQDTVALRQLLRFAPARPAVPLEDVESAAVIARRFCTGAMSFGSISAEAHETLAIAMNRLGGKSNSGEGGEEPRRAVADANGDLRRSAIKQVASGRFGVTTEYLVSADELQIKVAQGAKPGEGGQLPGNKVDARIAKVRWSTPGVTLISPPPHHDIYSIEDLSQLIYDLQCVAPAARISVKLVSEVGVGTVAAGVAKAGAGGVVVAGYEGGTGAAPLSSIKRAGLPWELGLAEAQQVLVKNRLRDRVRLQVDGGLRTSRDVVVAALLGAEEFGCATAPLVATGCVMLRKCHLNTCSVGIATQDPVLRARFAGTPEHVVRFFMHLAEGVRRHLAALGVRTLDEAVGQVEWLAQRTDVAHWKAKALELSPVLQRPDGARRCASVQRKDTSAHFDDELVGKLTGEKLELKLPVRNVHRAVGTKLSGEVARRFGGAGLPDGTVRLELSGSAGQSFGAFLAKGLTLVLEGDANDAVGKGLSGGRIVVRPPKAARFKPEENVILGNVALYGATRGELYVSGRAGERFAVRNSGATAVVEGVGDHGCEYMTGGVVVVLGPTGRNFAAGMSGGEAFVLDADGAFRERCNPEMVVLSSPMQDALEKIRSLVAEHVRLTQSPLGKRLLDGWGRSSHRFVQVTPLDVKRLRDAEALKLVGT